MKTMTLTNSKKHTPTTYSHGLDSPESWIASKHIHTILINYNLINKALNLYMYISKASKVQLMTKTDINSRRNNSNHHHFWLVPL